MKKILLLVMAAWFAMGTMAQINKSKNNSGTNTQTTNSGNASLTDADYYLAVAKVSVKTGKDNKENGSSIILRFTRQPVPITGAGAIARKIINQN